MDNFSPQYPPLESVDTSRNNFRKSLVIGIAVLGSMIAISELVSGTIQKGKIPEKNVAMKGQGTAQNVVNATME